MSPLAQALVPIFSDRPLPAPTEGCQTWGHFSMFVLDVPWEEVFTWLRDERLPPPGVLRMLVDLIEGTPSLPKTSFLDLLDKQLVDVTPARTYLVRGEETPVFPHNPRELLTLGAFMLRDAHGRFVSRLRQLPWRQQEAFLFSMEEQLRMLRFPQRQGAS